ncbi:hypothetical protein KJ966_22670 [bacterium]|nr:hypothetical protein [bacterium]
MEKYSIKELMACCLSRDIKDGEKVVVGANFPIPRAAVLLSRFTHAPNISMGMGAFSVNLKEADDATPLKFFCDYSPIQWAESAAFFPIELFCFHKLDVFFISGIQIDQFGNTNLIGIKNEKGGYKFRGPGSIGTTTLAAVAKRYYIVTEHHTPRVFVEKCSIVSALGFGDGSKGLRKSYSLPGNGPRYCVTPLCIFDFSPETRKMRLFSLHPGVSVEDVIKNTGFKPEIPDRIQQTKPPSKEELQILRNRIDPEGNLK